MCIRKSLEPIRDNEHEPELGANDPLTKKSISAHQLRNWKAIQCAMNEMGA